MSRVATKDKKSSSSITKSNSKASTKLQAEDLTKRKTQDNVKSGALAQAGKILGAINEANEIHSGKRKGKSFDEFLKEI